MNDEEREKCEQRLRIAIDLAQTGIEMQREKIRRKNPGATDDEIEALLGNWLRTRPGAEHGDGWAIPRESLKARRDD